MDGRVVKNSELEVEGVGCLPTPCEGRVENHLTCGQSSRDTDMTGPPQDPVDRAQGEKNISPVCMGVSV